MKTFMTTLLAAVGLVLVGFGASAWAQGAGFVCTYDCSQVCGSHQCYPGSWMCDGGGSRNYLISDTTLYGGCTTGSGACNAGNYMCVNRGYLLANCGTGCCVISNMVTFCKC